jgi:hypothetical protein
MEVGACILGELVTVCLNRAKGIARETKGSNSNGGEPKRGLNQGQIRKPGSYAMSVEDLRTRRLRAEIESYLHP